MLPLVEHSLRTGAPQENMRCSCKRSPSSLSTHIRERQKYVDRGVLKTVGYRSQGDQSKLQGDAFGQRCYNAKVRLNGRGFLPGQESQPAHHGNISLAQRQEDYDEFKAPTILGRCLSPEEHLRIGLFPSICAVALSATCNSSSRGSNISSGPHRQDLNCVLTLVRRGT